MKLLAVLLLIPGLRHVLRGGRVFDPANGIDRVTNVMSKLLNLGMSPRTSSRARRRSRQPSSAATPSAA